jgi:hypothetical protein
MDSVCCVNTIAPPRQTPKPQLIFRPLIGRPPGTMTTLAA